MLAWSANALEIAYARDEDHDEAGEAILLGRHLDMAIACALSYWVMTQAEKESGIALLCGDTGHPTVRYLVFGFDRDDVARAELGCFVPSWLAHAMYPIDKTNLDPLRLAVFAFLASRE